MKHLYKISFVAALLLTMAVNSVQAQLVVNYQNEKGAPETTQANSLNVVKEGLSFLINGIIDISHVNYIARFISNDTNEGKVEIPEEAEIKPEDITVIGDAEEVTVDEDGNFQTTSNNLVAVNPEGQMLYRTIVSLEEGEQMRNADLNAKETAISMLLPMFSSIFQGMPDDVMAQMKRLIAELPETDEMAKAIDRSIVKNKYLNMDDIESEFDEAVKKVADVSGLGEYINSSRRAAAFRAAATEDAFLDVRSLTRADVTVKNDELVFLKKNRTVNGYKGVFDVWNKKRLSYSAVKLGRKMLDGRMAAVNSSSMGCRILPPVRISRFVDSNTTWADIKAFITGGNISGGSEYGETMISDIEFDLSTNDDVVLIVGPQNDAFMQLYNVTRTNMAIVVSDIINILKNGGNEVQDQFYNDFVAYLYDYSPDYTNPFVDPADEKTTYSSYLSFFNAVYASDKLSAKEKFASIFKETFPLLQKFIKEGAETVESEQTKALLKQMDTEAAEKVFNNFDLYIALISAYGENTLGSLGLEEGNTGLSIDGLQGIEQPKLSANEIVDEMEAVYDLYIKYGCRGGDYAIASDFFYKQQMYTGTHPTLDTQATGWDRTWNTQDYLKNSSVLLYPFDTSSYMIGFINEFLADIEDTPNTILEAEARALRGSLYIYLAQNWGRVPLRVAGETPINIQNKEYPASDDEIWDFIIEDLKFAAEKLSWQPRDNKQGRCTKGMALAYLAEAYLWKAYKNGYDSKNIQLAASTLKQIIDSGYYELAPSYSTLWDGDIQWPKEAIWQFANEMDPTIGMSWTRNDWDLIAFYAACPRNGGWGSEFLSWELYFLFEQGDKRRDASLCTQPVEALPQAYRGYCYGRNPYTQETIDASKGYFYDMGEEHAPGIWSTKLWRLSRASWSVSVYPSVHYYFKRYAGILMDYAECLFRLNGGDDADAWAILDQIRHRAYGEFEANLIDYYYIGYFNKLASLYASDWQSPSQQITEYPVPFTRQPVEVEDAKSYYTRMTKEGLKVNNETLCKPFQGKAEVWQVALGQERRKEFNSEWNLRADLQRLGFMEAHMECNYPKGVGSANPSSTEWHTYRNWDFNVQKLLLPIPKEELNRNKYAVQNPGY